MRRSPSFSDAASGHCDKEMGRSALRRLRRALVNGVAIHAGYPSSRGRPA